MSHEAMDSVSNVSDWFASPDDTYLRVFGCQKPSHLLPRYAIDKLVMQEVAYLLAIGLSTILQRKNKAPWPAFPLHMGSYEIKNLKAAKAEVKELENLRFGMIDYHQHYPRGICKQHCAKLHFNWPCGTYSRLDEEKIKNYYSASRPDTPGDQAGPSHVASEQDTTLEARQREKSNPVSIKYKRKVSHNPIEEQSYKFKADPTILKAAMAEERKRKATKRRVEVVGRGASRRRNKKRENMKKGG